MIIPRFLLQNKGFCLISLEVDFLLYLVYNYVRILKGEYKLKSERKTFFLFCFQLVMIFAYTIPQVLNIISGKTKGLTLVLYGGFMIYITVNLILSIDAYRVDRTKGRRYLIFIYSLWVLAIGSMFVSGVSKITWREEDTLISIVIIFLSLMTLVYFKGVKDPFSKGFLAVWFKSFPQLWLAYTMLSVGTGIGLHPVNVVAAHCTSIPRLYHVFIVGREGGWDREARGLMLSEASNVFTWSIVTIVWII